MALLLDPVVTLDQRNSFLEEVKGIARLCNWSEKDCQGLIIYLYHKMISIDNQTYAILEEYLDEDAAKDFWLEEMDIIRKKLSLILGIDIIYK